eukprot:403374027
MLQFTVRADDPHFNLTESMGIVFTKAFFENVQHNFVVPLVKSLSGTRLGKLPRINADLGFLNLDLNFTNIQIYNLSVSDANDQVQLLDERVVIESKDLVFNISCDYSYITDPPIFADFGTQYLLLDHWDTLINGTTFYENDTIHVDINVLESSIGQFDMEFDGLSDFSIIFTDIVGSAVDLIGSKVAGLIGSQLATKLVPLINKLIQMIPGEIPIPNTDFYILGGFQSSLHVSADDYMRLPLTLSLQSRKSYFDGKSQKPLPMYVNDGYQMESFLSEYTVNSISYALHVEDKIKLKTNVFNTDFIGKLVGSDLFKYFDHNMTCEILFDTVDPYPHLVILTNYTQLLANMTADISCQKHENDTNLYHVVTLVLSTDIRGLITIDTNLTVKGNIQHLDATVASYYNSSIGIISLYYLQLEIAAAEQIMIGVINAVINQGYSFYWILTDILKITFLDIRQINMRNGDGYLQFQVTPVFNIQKMNEQIQELISRDQFDIKIDEDIIIDKYGQRIDQKIINHYNKIISMID